MRNFLRIFAIIYLGWAVIYSILVLPSWLPKVIAFKTKGGSDLVWQLEKAGFRVIDNSCSQTAISLTLDSDNGRTTEWVYVQYFWGTGAKEETKDIFEAHKKSDLGTKGWNQIIRSGKDWSVWFAIQKESGIEKLKILKKTVESLNVDPNSRKLHPITEVRFISSLNQWQPGQSLRTLVKYPPAIPFVFLISILAMLLTFPPHYINSFFAALSPYPLFYISIIIPILVYVALIRHLVKGLKSKGVEF